tara:strand:+ start:2893 stop:3522 length:630 start_codon:yes stop_codon:yes gene_type:complete
MNNIKLRGIYPVSIGTYFSDKSYIENVESVIKSGINIFQFRSKSFSRRRKNNLLKSIYSLCINNDVQLIINDHYDLVKKYDGIGLHVGSNDIDLLTARRYLGEEVIIGVSCYNSIENALWAETNGADYISLGAVYKTKSKESAIICPDHVLSKAREILNIPICMIGGINLSNISYVMKYKPDMISMISGIFEKDNPSKECKKLIKNMKL